MPSSVWVYPNSMWWGRQKWHRYLVYGYYILITRTKPENRIFYRSIPEALEIRKPIRDFTISYLINLPDIPLTSAEAAQYKIDWAPSTGYLKKIKPIIFQQNWENKEVCRKKLVCVRPGNAIFIVTLLNSWWKNHFHGRRFSF